MKNKRKIFDKEFFVLLAIILPIAILLHFFLTLFLPAYIIGGGINGKMPTLETMKEEFEEDKEALETIVAYMGEHNGFEIYITSPDDLKIIKKTDKINYKELEVVITDEAVLEAIDWFMEYGHIRRWGTPIIVGTGGEQIEFQIWSTLDAGCGMAYSYDQWEPYIEMVTELEPLGESGWYYYVDDYNVWRERQQANE